MCRLALLLAVAACCCGCRTLETRGPSLTLTLELKDGSYKVDVGISNGGK